MIACLTCVCTARAASGQLTATVRLATGEVRLTNVSLSDVNLVAYSVFDPSGELIVDNWRPVAGRTDNSVTGDGSFDPLSAWNIISPDDVENTLTTDELVEGTIIDPGGTLVPSASLYLGAVWNPQASSLLTIDAAKVGEASQSLPISYLPPGDFNEDSVVDIADYQLWRSTFGASGEGLLADGNADALVNLADYTVWRDHLGETGFALTASSAIALATVVPEPHAGILLLLALAIAYGLARRRPTARPALVPAMAPAASPRS